LQKVIIIKISFVWGLAWGVVDGEVAGGRGGDVGTKPTENKYNLMVHGKLLGCTLQIFTKQIC
jgi:hypothetical protein